MLHNCCLMYKVQYKLNFLYYYITCINVQGSQILPFPSPPPTSKVPYIKLCILVPLIPFFVTGKTFTNVKKSPQKKKTLKITSSNIAGCEMCYSGHCNWNSLIEVQKLPQNVKNFFNVH